MPTTHEHIGATWEKLPKQMLFACLIKDTMFYLETPSLDEDDAPRATLKVYLDEDDAHAYAAQVAAAEKLSVDEVQVLEIKLDELFDQTDALEELSMAEFGTSFQIEVCDMVPEVGPRLIDIIWTPLDLMN